MTANKAVRFGNKRGDVEPDTLRSWVSQNWPVLCVSALLVAVSVVFYATRGFGLFDVHPKDRLEDYGWGELKMIALRISDAPSDDAAIQIAKEFKLCDENGRIRADNCKLLTFDDGSGAQQVRVIGFRQDTMADGSGCAGITFCFAGPTDSGVMAKGEGGADTNVGGWEHSAARQTTSGYATGWAERGEKIYRDLNMHVVTVRKETASVVGMDAEGKPEATCVATADRYFLLSRTEAFGGDTGGIDGSFQYKLFADCANDSERAALLTAEGSTTWLRSSVTENGTEFYACDRTGVVAPRPSTTQADYVVAFCF